MLSNSDLPDNVTQQRIAITQFVNNTSNLHVAPTAGEDADLVFNPADVAPFFGYRRFDDDGASFELIASLVHHFESEKFRGVDETIRLEILNCATPKLAQKVSKRHMDKWRKDWKSVRGRVFRAGLAMQAIQNRKVRIAARQAFERSMELCGVKRIGGLPSVFIVSELQKFFQKPSNASCGKLGALAIRGWVPGDLCARLDAVFLQDKPISATVYAGADSDPIVEQWCIQNAIPVRVAFADEKRIREGMAPTLIHRANSMLVCIPPRRKVTRAVLAAIAAQRPKIKLIQLTKGSLTR